MGLPAGTIQTMRHAHCTGTESNSAIQQYHSVTPFLSADLDWQAIKRHYTVRFIYSSTRKSESDARE